MSEQQHLPLGGPVQQTIATIAWGGGRDGEMLRVSSGIDARGPYVRLAIVRHGRQIHAGLRLAPGELMALMPGLLRAKTLALALANGEATDGA
jgi:hypothetical protein